MIVPCMRCTGTAHIYPLHYSVRSLHPSAAHRMEGTTRKDKLWKK
nr:MAG TPA: hypothetical protein [Caudoviricetes sp.]